MKKLILGVVGVVLLLTGCNYEKSQEMKDAEMVSQQQSQLAKSQPVPAYNWSLERHLLIQLYNTRNMKAITHSVWRSNTGMIEGDCPSIGFGIPFDTSLTNPLRADMARFDGGVEHIRGIVTLEQAEPNGIFASKNTNATWVMCVNTAGVIEPHYVESKVSSYPYSVKVDYESNRVTKVGDATVTLSSEQ